MPKIQYVLPEAAGIRFSFDSKKKLQVCPTFNLMEILKLNLTLMSENDKFNLRIMYAQLEIPPLKQWSPNR